MSEDTGEFPAVDNGLILDLFAGPGGWSEGLRMLGLSDVGIEWDAAACQTRAAAGHLTIRADVAQYPTAPFEGRVWGLIASPPCQDFSLAGKMAGRTGDKGQLIDDVPRWVEALRPEWVALEQVPPALPVWEEFAHLFRSWGYSAWCGLLDAANFGVPQNRLRAILLASRATAALPPAPTHAEAPTGALFGPELEPWVSLEDALGIAPIEMAYKRGAGMLDRHGERPARPGSRPSFTLTGAALGGGGGPKMVLRTGANTMKGGRTPEHVVRYERATDRPAPTVDSKVLKAWKIDERPLTLTEALTLQSFRSDYPVQGTKGKQGEQVGNAVPPLLAAHVIGALTGSGGHRIGGHRWLGLDPRPRCRSRERNGPHRCLWTTRKPNVGYWQFSAGTGRWLTRLPKPSAPCSAWLRLGVVCLPGRRTRDPGPVPRAR